MARKKFKNADLSDLLSCEISGKRLPAPMVFEAREKGRKAFDTITEKLSNAGVPWHSLPEPETEMDVPLFVYGRGSIRAAIATILAHLRISQPQLLMLSLAHFPALNFRRTWIVFLK